MLPGTGGGYRTRLSGPTVMARVSTAYNARAAAGEGRRPEPGEVLHASKVTPKGRCHQRTSAVGVTVLGALGRTVHRRFPAGGAPQGENHRDRPPGPGRQVLWCGG